MQIRIGDKMVDVEMRDGVPVIKATSERILNTDGSVDVVIKVPCLQIQSKEN